MQKKFIIYVFLLNHVRYCSINYTYELQHFVGPFDMSDRKKKIEKNCFCYIQFVTFPHLTQTKWGFCVIIEYRKHTPGLKTIFEL